MHDEFEFIRYITKENGYPSNFVECQIRHTLNRFMQRDKKINTQVNDNETSNDRIIINVPFVKKSTKTFIKEITKLANQIKPTTRVIPIQRPPIAVRQLFKNKDQIPKDSQSNVVYQLNCTNCSSTYIGKTCRQACRRLKEHGAPVKTFTTQQPAQKRSARIAENKKFQVFYGQENSSEEEKESDQSDIMSAVKQHIKTTKHKIDWQNWIILDKDQHPYRLLVKESMAIVDKKPDLNSTTRSTPLIIYPTGYTKRRNTFNTNNQ